MQQKEGETIIQELNERIKELTCLYEISSIAAGGGKSLEETLHRIANRLPFAWVHSEDAVAEIDLDGQFYSSGQVPEKGISQQAEIGIDEHVRGHVRMHYPEQGNLQHVFLKEEQQLLEKVANEIAIIVERKERKEQDAQMKLQLQRNDRLTILGEITAGIAHELNTPLASILGFAQFIHDKSEDTQISKDSEKIIQSAIYAREVVKKLMFFSCEMPQRMELSGINDIVEDSIRLLKPMLSNARVDLVFQPDPRNAQSRLDPVQITQVVFNLLINAIHASEENGKINISISSDKEKILLKVSDEGHGIPAEIKHKIFEPFFSTKPTGEGSGLGLSVVHGIIKGHGGEISVESTEGSGTKFLITLPLNQA